MHKLKHIWIINVKFCLLKKKTGKNLKYVSCYLILVYQLSCLTILHSHKFCYNFLLCTNLLWRVTIQGTFVFLRCRGFLLCNLVLFFKEIWLIKPFTLSLCIFIYLFYWNRLKYCSFILLCISNLHIVSYYF